MTTYLKVSPLPNAELDRIRAQGVDDFGNELVVSVNQDEGGTPLRCCLREAEVGEKVALLAWRPAPHPGPYSEVGPVFVHAETCAGWPGAGYPEGFRHRQQIFRAYDSRGWQVESQLIEGSQAERALSEILARPEVQYVHSRNPLAGCYMFTVHAEVVPTDN